MVTSLTEKEWKKFWDDTPAEVKKLEKKNAQLKRAVKKLIKHVEHCYNTDEEERDIKYAERILKDGGINMSEEERPKFCTNEHLVYLDDLRETGVTNMFGAADYLYVEFKELSEKESKSILLYWMHTFNKDKR